MAVYIGYTGGSCELRGPLSGTSNNTPYQNIIYYVIDTECDTEAEAEALASDYWLKSTYVNVSSSVVKNFNDLTCTATGYTNITWSSGLQISTCGDCTGRGVYYTITHPTSSFFLYNSHVPVHLIFDPTQISGS